MSEEKEGIGTWIFAFVFWIVFGIIWIFERTFLLPSGTGIKIYERLDEKVDSAVAKCILMLIFVLISLLLGFLLYLLYPVL